MTQFSDNSDRQNDTRAMLQKIASILGVSADTFHNPGKADGTLMDTHRLLAAWYAIKNTDHRAKLLAMAQRIAFESNSE